jgi:hypothetical protein
VSELLPVGWVVRRQDDFRFAPLIARRLNHSSNKRGANLYAILLQHPAQECHCPGCSIDAVIGWRFVKQAENSFPQILVVDFAVRLGLRGKQTRCALAFKLVSIITNEGFADTQKFRKSSDLEYFYGSPGLPWRGCGPLAGRCGGAQAKWKGPEFRPNRN